MSKQPILIIDNVFAPSKKDRIINGVQKFSKAQREVLSDLFEVHYVTMKGSDIQYPNQYVLKNIQNVNASNNDKRTITKKICNEIINIINDIEPEYVLDNSCKHMSSLFKHYKRGVVFEHYYRPSMPLSEKTKNKFDKRKVFWCGVSQWQNAQFRNYFDGVTSVHLISKEEKVVESDNYGIFIGRWDGGKRPHVMIKRYLRNINFPIHIFTTTKNCVLTDDDKTHLRDIEKNKLVTMHYDAPREVLEHALQRATFVLGSGNESTGIVSLEGASYGVPYIVAGRNSVAEQEHMAPFAIQLLDRSKKEISNQLVTAVELFKQYKLEHRQKIAKDAYVRYNRSMFLQRQLELLAKAKRKYEV